LSEQEPYNRHIITDIESAKEAFKKLSTEPVIAVDTETNSLQWYRSARPDNQAYIIGVCIGTSTDGYYFPTRMRNTPKEQQLDYGALMSLTKKLLENPDTTKILHNAKFDRHFFLNADIDMQGRIYDTLNMHKLLHSDLRHGLKFLVKLYRIASDAGETEVLLKAKLKEIAAYHKKHGIEPHILKEVSYDYLPLDIIAPYGCDDAVYTYRLWEKLYEELERPANARMKDIEALETDLQTVLIRMERLGSKVNMSFLKEFEETELIPRMHKVQEAVDADFGFLHTNMRSSSVKQGILKLLGLESFNKHGRFTADRKALEKLAKKHGKSVPGLLHIVEWQKLEKLRSSYTQGIPKWAVGNIVHCDYSQMVKTGRLACSRPNLQNIPGRTDDGKQIRRAFFPPQDHIILCLDLSNVEMRIAAEMSREPKIINAYRDGTDLHTLSSSIGLGIPYDEVTAEQRAVGKTLNFAILYGSGPRTIAETITDGGFRCTEPQAKRIIKRFYAGYPVLEKYIARIHKEARTAGKAYTKFGRMRKVPEATVAVNRFSSAEADKKKLSAKLKAERAAFSHVIQGTAADVIKAAMVNMDSYLIDNKLKSKMVLTIHDEIVLYLHTQELHIVKDLVGIMEDFDEYFEHVPIRASIAASDISWGDKEEFESFDVFIDKFGGQHAD
jgi:DNA polymerase-1